MKKLIFIALSLLMVSSCQQIIESTPTIAWMGSAAYMEYDRVVEIIEANLGAYSEQEIEALKVANTELDKAKAEFECLAFERESLAELAVDLPYLMPLYGSMKYSYEAARNIIISRIDSYSLLDQAFLLRYDRTCVRFDRAIIEAMVASDGMSNEQIVRDILNFAGLVAKIILPLLLL